MMVGMMLSVVGVMSRTEVHSLRVTIDDVACIPNSTGRCQGCAVWQGKDAQRRNEFCAH